MDVRAPALLASTADPADLLVQLLALTTGPSSPGRSAVVYWGAAVLFMAALLAHELGQRWWRCSGWSTRPIG